MDILFLIESNIAVTDCSSRIARVSMSAERVAILAATNFLLRLLSTQDVAIDIFSLIESSIVILSCCSWVARLSNAAEIARIVSLVTPWALLTPTQNNVFPTSGVFSYKGT